MVLSIGLNPLLGLRVLEEGEVSLGLEVPAVVAEENLLEISIVEHMRVHGPSLMLGVLVNVSFDNVEVEVIVAESKGKRTHEGNVLLRGQIHFIELANHHSILVLVVSGDESVGSFSFSLDVFSSHSEDHGRSSAVLNSGVPSQLDEVRVGEKGGNMISIFFDVLNNINGFVVHFIICSL